CGSSRGKTSRRRSIASTRLRKVMAATLVFLARKLALNSRGMFSEPATHLMVGPCPFNGVGVPMVAFRPRSRNMRLEFLLTRPGPWLQVIVFERMNQDLRLVEPRGVGRRIARSPPPVTPGKVALGCGGDVARPAILDQEDSSQLLVVLVVEFQFGEVMLVVVL